MRRIAAIDTARLRLRPYRASDLDALHRLWTDAGVRRYLWDDRVIERDESEPVHSEPMITSTVDVVNYTGIHVK